MIIQQLTDNPWWWLALAVLLAIAEIVTPGVFLIFIAAAAAATVQLLLFALFSLACVAGGRRWYVGHAAETQDPLLNDRTARLIGRSVTVIDAIVNGEGRVKVDDGTWSAVGPDTPAGTRMVVVSADGPVLTVEKPAA